MPRCLRGSRAVQPSNLSERCHDIEPWSATDCEPFGVPAGDGNRLGEPSRHHPLGLRRRLRSRSISGLRIRRLAVCRLVLATGLCPLRTDVRPGFVRQFLRLLDLFDELLRTRELCLAKLRLRMRSGRCGSVVRPVRRSVAGFDERMSQRLRCPSDLGSDSGESSGDQRQVRMEETRRSNQ